MLFKFLDEQDQTKIIDQKVLDALRHHLYFTKEFSKGKVDERNTYYYEREWRLGTQNLPPPEFWNPDNTLKSYNAKQAGYSVPYCGKQFIDGEDEYFQFCEKDVAFLISPRDWKTKIGNPHAFPVHDYEELVNE